MDSRNGRTFTDIERLSIFELSRHFFGIGILQSREVIPIPKFTPLPNSNEVFLGVFNLRGEIYPITDISPILGLPSRQIHSDDMVILIDHQHLTMGVLVDKIHKVLNYSPNQIKSPRGLVPKVMENYLTGILEQETGIVNILNLDELFRAQHILAHY